MKINYISNQDLSITSGGWSGINANIYNQLSQRLDINYIGPISPISNIKEKAFSKSMRSVGLRGNFHYFSNNRLERINKEVSSKLLPADYNLFFGQTPWIKCDFGLNYGLYMDAAFPTYMDIFSQPKSFRKKDLLRIAKQEESWLQKSKHIFIGSQWAWDEMIKHYDIDEDKKVVVYTGGNIELPEQDSYKGNLSLVFISLNFEKKGGYICVDAFCKIKSVYPNATLTIIGEKPPEEVLKKSGIRYAGFLRKTVPEELEKFNHILSEAFLLIHPTVMDTMGAVLIEAGYFGCPSIAPKSFGIPELIINDKTGLIVDVPFSGDSFASKIIHLIKDKKRYAKMRNNSWDHTRTELTWDAIGNTIINTICSSL